jgi:glutathione S-transferase
MTLPGAPDGLLLTAATGCGLLCGSAARCAAPRFLFDNQKGAIVLKFYMHPVSTTCRPVMLFIADHNIEVQQQLVDLFTGEHLKPEFAAINPSCQVPVIDDDGFRLTESSAILKYLADKVGSPAYPKDLQARARINETMDWLNTGFYRTFGYGLCYGQLIDDFKLPDAAAQGMALAASKRGTERYLRVLDNHLLGAKKPWLCGDAITLADYLASGIVSVGDVIGCTFAEYPNLAAWYARMKSRPNWEKSNGAVQHWAQSARGPAYVTV